MPDPTVSPTGPASMESGDTYMVGWAWANQPVSELEQHYAATGAPRPMDGDSLVTTYPAQLRSRRERRRQVRDVTISMLGAVAVLVGPFVPSIWMGA